MTLHHEAGHVHHQTPRERSFWSSRTFLVFVGFAAIAAVLLWKEHSAHLLGVIPYLFILACPLMHLFHHGGHGHHGHSRPPGDAGPRSGDADERDLSNRGAP